MEVVQRYLQNGWPHAINPVDHGHVAYQQQKNEFKIVVCCFVIVVCWLLNVSDGSAQIIDRAVTLT